MRVIMSIMHSTQKSNALDFFLNLGIVVSLYAGVGFLLNLLFSIINSIYPVVGSYYSYPSISFPVAALMILTPVFLILSNIIAKAEVEDPEKRNLWIKRWATYLTMFLSGALVVGDLITILYYFLDGQDLTTAFILKALSVLVVLGAVFAYYWSGLNASLSSRARTIWRVGALTLVLLSIILGFNVIGSPQTQRNVRLDQQKVYDLQNIQNQIISYWQGKGTLPENLDGLKDSLSYNSIPLDPQSKEAYEYRSTGTNSFELCATFNSATMGEGSTDPRYNGMSENDNWKYSAGRNCFTRTIDPQLYPMSPKPVFR